MGWQQDVFLYSLCDFVHPLRNLVVIAEPQRTPSKSHQVSLRKEYVF